MLTHGMWAVLALVCVSAGLAAFGRPQHPNSVSAHSPAAAAHLRSEGSHKTTAHKGLRRSSEPVKVLYDQPDLSAHPSHESCGSHLEPHVRSLLNIALSQVSPRAPPAAV